MDQNNVRVKVTTTVPLWLYKECKDKEIRLPSLIMIGWRNFNKNDVLEDSIDDLKVKIERMSGVVQRLSIENADLKHKIGAKE